MNRLLIAMLSAAMTAPSIGLAETMSGEAHEHDKSKPAQEVIEHKDDASHKEHPSNATDEHERHGDTKHGSSDSSHNESHYGTKCYSNDDC